MTKLWKLIKGQWKALLLVMLFLIVQAACDLSLPQFTVDIIDTGITNGGVEHILPEKIRAEEYEKVAIFLTEEEAKQWEQLYEKMESGTYTLKPMKNKELQEAEEQFQMPVIVAYSMEHVSKEDATKYLTEMMAKERPEMADQLQTMDFDQLCAAMGMEFRVYEEEVKEQDGQYVTKTYVDMALTIQQLVKSKMMKQDVPLTMRTQMEEGMAAVGTTVTKSMGILFARQEYVALGTDMEQLQTAYLWKSGVKMLGVTFLMAAAMICVGYVSSRVGARLGRDLRGKVFHKVVSFSNVEMNQFSIASLITRSTNDIQQVQMVSTMILRMVAYAPILGIGGIIKVVRTGSGMGWILALSVVVIISIVMMLMVIAMPKFKQMQKLIDGLNLVAREILTGLPVIRAFGREAHEEERFDIANKKLMKTMLFTNRVMTFMMPLMMILMNATSILIVWVASHKIDAGTLEIGTMTAFITYAMLIIMSFLIMTALAIFLPRAEVAAGRIDEILETPASIVDRADAKECEIKQGVVDFNHVAFRYPGAEEYAIEDITFTANPGETTAIIGSTGSGKSTMIQLIPRFFDVDEGSISIDGCDIRSMTMHSLREGIGYVPQKGVLFSGTIESNIKYAGDRITDEQMKEAAEIAQATEFIHEKKEQYNSSIAQGGTNVSGGQKQRLSIARAIAKNPKIYIFDDSFSALDYKTDAVLRKALYKKVEDATVIIVAQRISTILHAEKIVVMDEGRIVGIGTHEELLANNEVYQQIAKSQLTQAELARGKVVEAHESK